MRGLGLTMLPEFYEYEQRARKLTVEPLLVTVCTLKSVSIRDPLALDSIIGKAVYYECMKGEPLPTLKTPYWIPLPLEVDRYFDHLPLWRATDFFPINAAAFNVNTHRRTGDNPYSIPAMMPTIGQKKVRRQPSSVAGQYIDFRVPETRIVADRWQAACMGNKEEIDRLLNTYIHNLGGKSSRGAGRTLDWHVESLDREFSFTDDQGRYLRPVPTEEGGTFQAFTLPYWRRDLWRMCENSYAREFIHA